MRPTSPANPVRPAGVMPGAATPWGTGLTVAAFTAGVCGVAIVVLSIGLIRVTPLLAAVLNLVAVGGVTPTVWQWRRTPVLRWFVLGGAIGVVGGWLTLLVVFFAG